MSDCATVLSKLLIMDFISQGRINLRFTNRDHHGGLHKAVLNGKESDVEHLLSSGKGKVTHYCH